MIEKWALSPRNSPNFKDILWLSGMAGIGKSTIAYTAAEYFDQKGLLGASFFCSRRSADRKDRSRILPTLAYQLCHYPRLAPHFANALRSGTQLDATFMNLQDQLQMLLLVPFRRIKKSNRPVVIVIDALDECEDGFEAIISLLAKSISNLPFPFRLLVTSRPEQSIRSTFRSVTNQSILSEYELHKVDSVLVQADIHLYLDAEFLRIRGNMVRDAIIALDDSWPSKEDLAELSRTAGALFIYAATVLRFIDDPYWNDPMARLETILEREPSDRKSPLQQLDALYLEVLKLAIPDEANDPQLYNRFRLIVGSIILLQDPLCVSSLEMLIGVTTGTTMRTVARLHSVLVVPRTDTTLISSSSSATIEVLHRSFPDFLQDPARCSDERFLIVSSTGHAILAQRCLSCLNGMLKRNFCQLENPLENNPDIATVEEMIPQHLRYACLFWADHISHADPSDSAVLEQLHSFCSQRLLAWLEIMSLLGRLDKAILSVQKVKMWLENKVFHLHFQENNRLISCFVLNFIALASLLFARRCSTACT